MNAGKIDIQVSANYGMLEQQLVTAATRSEAIGRQAGSRFGDAFDKAGTKFLGGFTGKLGKLGTFEMAMRGIATSFKSLSEGKSGSEAIQDLIDTLPGIGSVNAALREMTSYLMGIPQQEKAQREMVEAAERTRKATEQRLATQKEITDSIQRNADREREIASSMAISKAEESGDTRLAARLKADEELARLEARRQKELAEVRSQEQENSVERVYRKERQLIEANLERQYREISAKEAEIAQQQAQKDAERREREREEAQKRIEDLEKQREEVGSATGSAQTRLGTFRFAAYSDAEKKQIDQAILQEIRGIRSKTSSIASGGIQ